MEIGCVTRVIDNTDPIGEGVTKEWVVRYSTKKRFWLEEIFIVHAKTVQEALEHFVSLKPDTLVKEIEYYGIYF